MEVTTQTGHYYRVERRYSAFHNLNKQCKKLGLITPEFPPKRIRNTSAKVLESRRKGKNPNILTNYSFRLYSIVQSVIRSFRMITY